MVSMFTFFSPFFTYLKGEVYTATVNVKGKGEKKDDQNWSLVSVQTHQLVSSVPSFPPRSNSDCFFSERI